MDNLGYAFLIIIGTILIVIFMPFGVIWSLNTLFPVLAIPYDFWTWLATLFLMATIFSKSVTSNNKS